MKQRLEPLRLRGTVAVAAAFALATAGLAGAGSSASAETVTIYASGSLRHLLPATLAKDAGLPGGTELKLTFGPGGKLGDRIETGEKVDLFLSADMKVPRRLVQDGHALVGPIPLARNHMCLIAPKAAEVTSATVLEHMLAPGVTIATSTPVVDPGGDYAYQIFDKAEALKPGAAKALRAKARQLLGNPQVTAEPGHSLVASLFLRHAADMLIFYCSSAPALLKEVPDLVSIRFPPALDPEPVSGMALVSDQAAAARIALFLLSERGQRIVKDAGFEPLVPEGASPTP